ncbi:MAG TPA: cysteine peptidase family C39 domain-containing protein [Chthoniobacter sp.]
MRLGSVGHFIAVLAMDGDVVTVADPMHGKRRISLTQFQKQYVFTDFHMAVSRR